MSHRYRAFQARRAGILALLLIAPVFAWADPVADTAPEQEVRGAAEAAAGPADPNEPPLTWIDTSHSFATNQTLALAQWMDDFFGDPEYDADRAESFLRLQFQGDWDQEDDESFRVRLRGRVQLPKLSKRLSLVFSGEDGDELTEDERDGEDTVGLQVEISESRRSRWDATLGFTSSGLRPGVRFRRQDVINEKNSYRFTQRVQWEDDDGFYTTGQVDLNHFIDEDDALRWSNRVVYGEETDGAEWRTRLAWRQRRDIDGKRPYALSYFGAINGVTDPSSYVKNYRLGVEFRRKIYRDFLFFEVEPSWNYRRRNYDDDRDTAWAIMLRLEVALQRDLMRKKSEGEGG
jgi:hypothetical protein